MRRSWGVVAMVVAVCASGLLGVASGHGSMEDPISRVYRCRLENPERPTSPACIAAVALSGTQAFYDWNEVNLPFANGRHRELIPDSQLCSAGRDKYKGLDLPRDDWLTTPLSAGVAYTFLYRATAPHRGYFEFYVTRDGYDPTEPLAWADLEDSPFITVADPALVSGSYRIPGTTPAGKTGHHLIYVIWQRTDSPEAFYSCSDVDFGEALPFYSTT
uniref:Chitin binding protein n=1 Tax=Microsorum sp. SU-2018 TaxID=2079548 RepID=A0A455I2A7_9MONI|nr:chitin binding protein [Microsorum sp. SU-2018]